MEEAESDPDLGFGSGFGFGSGSIPPALVSLAPFTPAPSPAARRLSSQFAQPSRPVASARRLAYVSLQGRLVNAEEATSARAIGGGLGREEVAAWELFSPIQRVLLVAVVGVAVAESRKNRLILQLRNSVELRDQILSSMQQKLDNLCQQVHNVKDREGTGAEAPVAKNFGFPFDATFESNGIEFVDCGCWLCDQHHKQFGGLMSDSTMRVSNGNDNHQSKMTFTEEAEPEERRMSDLSDWASSVTSATELQTSAIAIEQDVYILKRECEEKDATIKELTGFLQSCDAAGSKRIAELEDIIRRKNVIITKLKKDMVILEQKVVHLTRLRRPSSQIDTDTSTRQFPIMADNLLYDMDSSTSPSSSDSDSSPKTRPQAFIAKQQETPAEQWGNTPRKNHNSVAEKTSSFTMKSVGGRLRSRSVSPLKEISTNEKLSKISSERQRQLPSAGGDSKRNRKQTNTASKDVIARKRWF
ncbi:LOW QUALITY PROTEIN: uncharacterized protein LOC115734557 [Rhodamnia argentea]|uniref:LOW QUALITY PROTEIN: uncharacterized protein LOC115734557 n=1 Tax=Rhodamnia argentea TaxID=178133 RepID=A0A8B8NFM5_9MYRT|nr:LOW QUALITY PROTEIN: uncharacterized protein LOC115734557 [Rhodamnia argentea]